jgi:cytochrome c peroxidase
MSLVNVAYNGLFNWSDPTVHSLEEQALKPMLSTNPVELGMSFIQADFIKLIRSDATYRPQFRLSFPGQPDPYTIPNIARALATFERTIVSANSPYDRFHFEGDESANLRVREAGRDPVLPRRRPVVLSLPRRIQF